MLWNVICKNGPVTWRTQVEAGEDGLARLRGKLAAAEAFTPRGLATATDFRGWDVGMSVEVEPA